MVLFWILMKTSGYTFFHAVLNSPRTLPAWAAFLATISSVWENSLHYVMKYKHLDKIWMTFIVALILKTF